MMLMKCIRWQGLVLRNALFQKHEVRVRKVNEMSFKPWQ